jgi:ribosomal protein S18 acetylase RimI-like enzyme
MKIRRLASADAQEFFDVRIAGLREFPEAFGESVEEFQNRTIAEIETNLAATETSEDVIVGAFDERLVGVVGFRTQSQSKTAHTGVLWGMFVLPEARRNGVARSLLAEILAHAKSAQGVEQIKLAVESSNLPAVRLYESFGFQRFGIEPRALKLGGKYYAEDLMMLELDTSR